MSSIWGELKRRNVVRVAIAYAIVSWLILQLTDVLVPLLTLPEWIGRFIFLILLVGLPLALFFTWAFELTPEGIKREKDVDRSQSLTAQTGRKLDFLIIGVLVIAVAFLLLDKFSLSDSVPEIGDLTSPDRQSIAVLPFENFSDDNDNFADGLSEELMNVLAQNPDLQVAGRTSSFSYKGQTPNYTEVGEALNVDFVLEGSVRRAGDTVRITAQLISVDDGHHTWSRTYDQPMVDIFEIQDAVANAIATQLKVRLMPESKRPTDNIKAYALYLEAIALFGTQGTSINEVFNRLDRAIALDHEFAKAYEYKAMTYWYTGVTGQDSEEARPIVYEAARRALELDPTLILAKPFLAAGPGGMHWREYMEMMDQAISEDPENYALLGVYRWDLMQTGYFDEALQISYRIAAIDPLNLEEGYDYAIQNLLALGRFAEAKAIAENTFDKFPARKEYWLFWIHLLKQEFEQAISSYEVLLTHEGKSPSWARVLVDGATDPNHGKAFLDQFVQQEQAEAESRFEELLAYDWYLAFGYIDEHWEIAKQMETDTLGPWKRGYELRQTGALRGGKAFRSHRYYITQEKIELWESRGAPDTCRQEAGEWICW
jgi:TolB-like protein